MNIVYISKLSGNKAAGLTYSVPAQVESQSKIDKVFWLNLDPNYKRVNNGNVDFKNREGFSFKNISKLPHPFNFPDLVIFQGVYFIDYCIIAKELIKLSIPYIIVPRGSLTKGAQLIKSHKKKIANKLIFYRFINNALALQFLNIAELKNSGNEWNRNYLIIPNGITTKTKVKVWGEPTLINGIFIGRLDVYHKGIDLLIEACGKIKDELDGVLQIEIYGHDQGNSRNLIKELIAYYELENIIKVKKAVFDSEKESLLLSSDFFVLTSRFEGHPMGLLEALSYGLPCLVTSGTNMAKEIKFENAGWTAETNVESIIKALRMLVQERKTFIEKSKCALGVSKNYDWDILAQKSHEMYIQLLEQRNQISNALT